MSVIKDGFSIETNKPYEQRQEIMKANKMTFIAAMALGSMLALGTAFAAETNAPAASAPPAGGPPPGGQGMRGRGPNLEQLAKDLNLTDDQKEKVKAVLDDQRQKMGELRNVPQDERRTKMQALREEVNTKMKAILNEEQYAKWEKSRPMMGSGRQRNGGAANGGETKAPKADKE